MSNDYIVALLPRLTRNAAYNLAHSVTAPCPLNPDSIHGKGRIHTGMGKWTTLAAIGVENNVISLGLAERRGEFAFTYITPLGREVAAYLAAHWDEVDHLLRDTDQERIDRDRRRIAKLTQSAASGGE